MNKYVLIIIIVILVLGGGVVYRQFLIPEASKPCAPTGTTRDITIIAVKDEWKFTPEDIDVKCGDSVVLTVVNEDSYDHGIGIDAVGVSQRMPANSTIKVEFVATQVGDLPFYCSVPCGEGDVEGKHRTHLDMVGKIHVQSLISNSK
ncbi:MAG: hypothetical protein A3C84_05135 [Candidatus Ryanbacteria bacterium RIFCSPHIGHO2_02_FULL_48_12]|uniref:EfeO-type cupredoxin-like domain-containing protein n=1 Tax=Candidatus Ryanbacteria bacterium RIFCSPHIGHO2_01_FULL_48_27 TaxID=1802115 RepID=A0A1G2G7B0_9BACT|nr:MAG: hypothetical protein A2756_05990 [Candidatus Ryanbacteria bacterium RIFCSPHIGHO2_01_FULL_48_27]OGZ49545.1 MAG: hypothetical protein A3C84_05135 [Candidatus Ryanbacteria bacterium RIFCSPHIGHO2_02_FULL_48_12]